MDYIELQGVRLPALGFGTMRLTGDDGVTAIRRALDISAIAILIPWPITATKLRLARR